MEQKIKNLNISLNISQNNSRVPQMNDVEEAYWLLIRDDVCFEIIYEKFLLHSSILLNTGNVELWYSTKRLIVLEKVRDAFFCEMLNMKNKFSLQDSFEYISETNFKNLVKQDLCVLKWKKMINYTTKYKINASLFQSGIELIYFVKFNNNSCRLQWKHVLKYFPAKCFKLLNSIKFIYVKPKFRYKKQFNKTQRMWKNPTICFVAKNLSEAVMDLHVADVSMYKCTKNEINIHKIDRIAEMINNIYVKPKNNVENVELIIENFFKFKFEKIGNRLFNHNYRMSNCSYSIDGVPPMKLPLCGNYH